MVLNGREEQTLKEGVSTLDCGIQVNDAVIEAFNTMKIHNKKTVERTKFLFLTISDDDHFLILNEEPDSVKQSTDDDYLKFLSYLKPDCCCILIYDVSYETANSIIKDDLVAICWCPQDAPPKQKLQYASASTTLSKKLHGFKALLQLNSLDDISRSVLAEKLGKGVVKIEGVPV
ncbi:cofilin-2-like isoform X1 [Chiloscyllium plagiosum]|uniref:cofilin-2-like isoform X1 n=1 Tax=Chiloscyllium plagiosum TaxID=36176 RepID=UPI001CB7C21A|nr:cofilin-2-like isoform X1 [Chiloscyllium plagiosum]